MWRVERLRHRRTLKIFVPDQKYIISNFKHKNKPTTIKYVTVAKENTGEAKLNFIYYFSYVILTNYR